MCTCAVDTASGDQVPYDLQHVLSQGTCHPGTLSATNDNLAPEQLLHGKTCSSVYNRLGRTSRSRRGSATFDLYLRLCAGRDIMLRKRRLRYGNAGDADRA